MVTWATVSGTVLRLFAIVAGGTFAIHRLANRLADRQPTAGADSEPVDPSYATAIREALEFNDPVPEALGRTLALALVGAIAGIVIGALVAAIRRRRANQGTRIEPGIGLGAASVLALAVPGLAWIPLNRLAVDAGILADEPPSPSGDGLGPLLWWGLLVGVAIAPTVASAMGPNRPWAAGRAVTGVPLGLLVTRSSPDRWHLGPPTRTFGLALAGAELLSANQGVFDRFYDAAAGGSPDLLVPLAAPAMALGAVVSSAAGVGPTIVGRQARPLLPPGPDAEPAPRWPSIAVVAVGLAAAVSAVVGWSTDPGSDEAGLSSASLTASALGVSLVASAVPALAATAVGAGLAVCLRALGRISRTTVGAAIDLLSWPAALIVPLAALTVTSEDQPLLDPIVLQVAGLLLVPKATWLLTTQTRGWARTIARLAATAFLLGALALAAHLLAGFLVPAGPDARAGLGQLVAGGLDAYDTDPWPVLIPLAAAVLSGTALYGVGSMLWGTRWAGRRRPRPEAATDEIEDLQLGSLAAASETAAGPPAEQVLDLNLDPATRPDPATDPDPSLDLAAAPWPPQYEGVIPAEPVPLTEPEPEPAREPVDIRDDVTVDSATDLPPPGDEDDQDDAATMADEASRTIELRPSDLRQAGIEPPPAS